MRSIRGRLAVWYSLALGATLLVFATTIYLVQRSDNLTRLDERAREQADRIASTLRDVYQITETIVVDDPLTARPSLARGVASAFEAIPDYVVVWDSAGGDLYLSGASRALSIGAVEQLLELHGSVAGESEFGSIDVGPPIGEVRYYIRPVSDAGPVVARVLTGIATSPLVLGPQRMLIAMLLIAPLIIVASVFIGYFLAGHTLKPVDSIVDEVEAITDGRGLHRRLAELRTNDELARLTTTLNAMIGRLETSFATLRRFTADASHELKTPLTILRSGVERAITHPETPPDVLETLEETLVEVNRMAELVDSLLMLARADEGRAPLHLESVDLRDLLGEISETASILGDEALVSVSIGIPQAPVRMAADPSRIRQLLMNLVTNAIKYTPKGGTVGIDCTASNGKVVLQVKDTGVGIAPGQLSHVFDRFWRADPARSRTGQRPGAGLGLAICKWITEAHGGTISVQSSPGRGTTFTIILPLDHET